MKLLLSHIALFSFLVVHGTQLPKREALILPRVFSDHMVLQQRRKVACWGWSHPGERLTIRTGWGSTVQAFAGTDGAWKTWLSTPAAGGPYIIAVRGADTSIVIHDVLIGEVWLASGQSNMDIPVKGWPPGDTIFNSKREISEAKYPKIRFLKVPFGTAASPSDSLHAEWVIISPETAGNFSATAYFFAQRLHRELHVPVGIVQSSIGGTPVEAWTSAAYLSRVGDFDKELAGLLWKESVAKINSNTPSVLFNAMIHPLLPFTIRGVIWYQGESNVGRAQQYKKLFPLMIRDWRNKWGYELPFYYVQLAPYMYSAPDQKGQAPKLRDAQRAGLQLPRTGMVSTLDIGYIKTAHPPYKQEVGQRLAGLALVNEYGRKMVASGPIYDKASVSGKDLRLSFTSTGSGLVAGPTGLYNFEIAGKDKRYVAAMARIVGDKVVVSAPSIAEPVYARYAWSDSSKATLFNREGLSAATFTSDTSSLALGYEESTVRMATDTLPGKGAAEFDFFYAGEAKSRNMYIVRAGEIIWSYMDTMGRGEISDAILMPDGDVLFAHQFGVTLIDHDKKVLWNYDAPEGFETHTAQLIGKDHVVFVQNGSPASVIVMNIPANRVVRQFPLPFKSGTHGQIRHARLTDRGTLLVAHMDLGKVCEYDINGKELLSIDVPSVWSAVELKNGHILVTSNQDFVKEITRAGEVIWDLPLKDMPEYKITNPQLAVRLSNGNTLINNWFNQWNAALDAANPPVQAIEVTPDKKVIWALRQWMKPMDLGPSTTIQILDGSWNGADKAFFGNIR